MWMHLYVHVCLVVRNRYNLRSLNSATSELTYRTAPEAKTESPTRRKEGAE